LLHGFPQTSACWTALLETLAAAGYRAVAPDQRGYSPKARPTPVRADRLPELVADVLAITDRLGAETFHLVGHDWGGVVAWRLAGGHPDRVATLTAVSTPHPPAFARALVAGTQALRSAYIPLFRIPGLPERLLGGHRQGGCIGCRPRTGWAPTGSTPTPGPWPTRGCCRRRWPGIGRPPRSARRPHRRACRHWLPEHHAGELGRLLLEHLRRWNTRHGAGGPLTHPRSSLAVERPVQRSPS
jgi:pimeloyl-ACP methyl ester carboxylesterase